MDKPIAIGICDDERSAIDELKQIITLLADRIEHPLVLRSYTSPKKLLTDAGVLRILFLDLDMPGMDGIEVGRKMLHLNPGCRIIMATGRSDRYKEAFHINALRFVTKPFSSAEILEAIQAALVSRIGNEIIVVSRERITYEIKQKDISYIRAQSGYVEIYTLTGSFRKDISMKEMESLLDDRLFVRIHNTYIVGLPWISAFNKAYVRIGDVSLPISRRRFSEFQNKHIAFDLDYRLLI